MEKRSDDILLSFNGVIFKKREHLDLSKVQQLPTYRYLLERYLTELKQLNKKDVVQRDIVSEFRKVWIYMNVSPQTRQGVQKKFKQLFKDFDTLRYSGVDRQKGPSWKNGANKIVQVLDNGVDIKATEATVIQDIQTTYGVEEGDWEKKLYEDNCVCGPDGKCSRIVWCGGVDQTWVRKANERRKKIELQELKEQKRQNKVVSDQERLKTIRENYWKSESSETNFDEETTSGPPEVEDEFVPGKTSLRKSKTITTQPDANYSTRSRSTLKPSPLSENPVPEFPPKMVRTGFKTFDVDVMEALVVMESEFKVDAAKAPKLLCFIANKVFKQNWIVAEETENESEEENTEPVMKKPKKYQESYSNVLPSRTAVRHWVESFSLLSFTDMAESIAKAKENEEKVTFGTDDTIKAAGAKRHDIKSGHITIIDKDHHRESFSTGFHENLSHSGKDAATIMKMDISKMAILTDNTFEDMISMIDYFMHDRAGDGDKMLDVFGIAPEKRLKCNAHILLCVDNALDKVFKDMETVVGPSNLIAEGASHVFNGPTNSIWYLGLIALAKLLSPSHNVESISLHKEYKDFLKRDSISDSDTHALSEHLVKNGFSGFVSNRFGRIGELSVAVVSHDQLIDKFFENQVNEHSNKLVLAVSCFKDSAWFLLCAEVSRYFYDEVCLPIKFLLGIDDDKYKEYPGGRSWKTSKEKLFQILDSLKELSVKGGETAKDRLVSIAAKKIESALRNQIMMMKFYQDDDIEDIPQAPQTNLGCESEFGSVGNDLKSAGGAVSLQTISDKHVIARNALYKKERWTDLTEFEKRKKWKWASGSPQAKKVKEIEQRFREQVLAVQKLAVKAKEKKKLKIKEKLSEALMMCKKHGGPLTIDELDNLDKLNYEQTLAEATYLKKTTAPNIRYKRKVENKFIPYTEKELKQQIRDAIKPTCDVTKDIEQLLLSSAFQELETAHAVTTEAQQSKDEESQFGMVGLWYGPLDEQSVGVAIDDSTLQLYRKTRFGFVPCAVPVDITEWNCIKQMSSYHYIEKGGVILLVLDP